MRQAFPFQSHARTRLCSGLYVYTHGILKGWNFDRVAKCGLGYSEQEVVDDIVGIADEGIGSFFLYEYLNVAGNAVVSCCMSAVRDRKHHSLLHSGRNVYLDDFFAVDDALAVALCTSVVDDGTFAMASLAGNLLLHDAEDALCLFDGKPLSMTVGTGLRRFAVGASAAMTVGTGDFFLDFEFFRGPCEDVLEVEAYLYAEVTALIALWSP